MRKGTKPVGVMLLLAVLLPWEGAAPSGSVSAPFGATPVTLTSVVADPQQPLLLYLEGTINSCGDEPGASYPCGSWLLSSSDGGTTWRNLARPQHWDAVFSHSPDPVLDPALIASNSRYVYVPFQSGTASIMSVDRGFFWTADRGRTWHTADYQFVSAQGHYGFVVSLAQPTRLYAHYVEGEEGGENGTVAYTDDFGRTWHNGTPPVPYGTANTIVPSPQRAGTVFTNVWAVGRSAATPPVRPFVYRSATSGATWTAVRAPQEPSLSGFTVAFDEHDPGLLVGTPTGLHVAGTQRYFSRDGGGTWTLGSCAGDYHGACPRAVLYQGTDGYSFLNNHIFLFRERGPAQRRIDAGPLPFSTQGIVGVATGQHSGDPLYVLATGRLKNAVNVLYRSSDRGHHWRVIASDAVQRIPHSFRNLKP